MQIKHDSWEQHAWKPQESHQEPVLHPDTGRNALLQVDSQPHGVIDLSTLGCAPPPDTATPTTTATTPTTTTTTTTPAATHQHHNHDDGSDDDDYYNYYCILLTVTGVARGR